MRLLFTMDMKNYDINKTGFIRHSARAIIIKENKVAMVKSIKYDYYKFPGGGIEENESNIDALIRETKEEAGLVIIPSSILEYGYVHRIEKSNVSGIEYFLQDNFYYLCNVEAKVLGQNLDSYEQDESFTLEWVDPATAIKVNRYHYHQDIIQSMLEREAKVLELLMKEGII